jgi:hypothetical protein
MIDDGLMGLMWQLFNPAPVPVSGVEIGDSGR